MANNDNHMQSDQRVMMVRLWDLGPSAPEAPVRPEAPKGKEGSPDFDLAMVDFRAELQAYENALAAFGRAKKDFAAWHEKYGGTYEIEMYSCNAREALENDPNRYVVSDARLQNHGLPKGRKPGKYHAAEQDRIAEDRRAFNRTAATDPVFGSQFVETGAA